VNWALAFPRVVSGFCNVVIDILAHLKRVAFSYEGMNLFRSKSYTYERCDLRACTSRELTKDRVRKWVQARFMVMDLELRILMMFKNPALVRLLRED
jgi:hypothetical protein